LIVKRKRTVDPVLAESFEVPKLWTSDFSAKHRVIALVIYKLRAEGRRDKG
jgi:hypothetical protein